MLCVKELFVKLINILFPHNLALPCIVICENCWSGLVIFCFHTICRDNPKGETGTSDDIWNDDDDESVEARRQGMATRGERVTGLQSGFEHLNVTGYREAVLGDFDQSEELGRLNGFQSGFIADPEVNPSLALARMEGLLMALSHKTSQREEETQVCTFIDFHIY